MEARAQQQQAPSRTARERRVMAMCRFSRRFDFQHSCIEWRHARDSALGGCAESSERTTLFVALSSASGVALMTVARLHVEGWVVLQGAPSCIQRSSLTPELLDGVSKVVWWLDPSATGRPSMSVLRRALGVSMLSSCDAQGEQKRPSGLRHVVMLGSLGDYEKMHLGVRREGNLATASTSALLADALAAGEAAARERQWVLESATIDIFSAIASYAVQRERGWL
ncbi:MAG: hypothetical protein RBU37_25990 [Myxococcota bacterium]|nr:hypothetical protein [Myxococcota bacterium]